MDRFERLAAFLADELDADERTGLEADLERDPQLRAGLEAMRRADVRLATLRSPTPPDGFAERLDDALTAAVADVIGRREGELSRDDDARDPDSRTGDSVLVPAERFAAGRARRDPKRTLIGVAAAAVLLVGGGVVVSQFAVGGGDDSTTESAMDGSGDATDEAASELSTAQAGQPVVVADERELTDDDLDDLLSGDELEAVRRTGLDPDTGRDLAGAYQAALGARTSATGELGPMLDEGASPGAGDEAQEEDTAEAPQAELAEESGEAEDSAASGESGADVDSDESPADDAVAELFTRDGQALPPEAAGDVARCLESLLRAETDAIPAYAELGTYDGVEAVIFGLVTLDPASGNFSRTEVWALDRATCQVLRFSQG